MNESKYMILIIKYNENNEGKVEELIDSAKKEISASDGKMLRAYQGSEERIVSAVEKILKLTK